MVEKEFEKQIDKDNKQVKIFSPKYCKCGCGRELKYYNCRGSYTLASKYISSHTPKKPRYCKCGAEIKLYAHRCDDCRAERYMKKINGRK